MLETITTITITVISVGGAIWATVRQSITALQKLENRFDHLEEAISKSSHARALMESRIEATIAASGHEWELTARNLHGRIDALDYQYRLYNERCQERLDRHESGILNLSRGMARCTDFVPRGADGWPERE